MHTIHAASIFFCTLGGAWCAQLKARQTLQDLYVWDEEQGPVRFHGSQLLQTLSDLQDSPAQHRGGTTSGRSANRARTFSDNAQHLQGHVIVIPAKKLAFCFIPKVASAEFNHMFDKANGISDAHRKELGRAFHNSAPARFNISARDINHRKGWQFAVFLRDPLQRFLSAFGSKCLPAKGGGAGDAKYCGGIVGDSSWQSFRQAVSLGVMVDTFEQHAARFMEELYVDGGLRTDNAHYARQIDILKGCGTRNFGINKADFVGKLSGDVHSQVRAMFRMSGMKGKRASSLIMPHFPKTGVAGHRTHLAHEVFYRNETIAAMVRRMYAADYDLIEQMPQFI